MIFHYYIIAIVIVIVIIIIAIIIIIIINNVRSLIVFASLILSELFFGESFETLIILSAILFPVKSLVAPAVL